MFLSVLTKEISTKNLVTFNFNIMGVFWKIWFFLGGESTHTKREGWTVCRFNGEGVLAKRGNVFSPILEDRVHAMTLPNQKTPKHDCMTAEILRKRLSNEWLQTQGLRKEESIWKNSNWVETMLVASHPSRILVGFFT